MGLTDYGNPLIAVFSFKYLGRVMPASDENWKVVISNIWKEQRKWAQLLRVLGWEGKDTPTSGNFYLAVVQAVLLFGLDIWVMSPRIGSTLGGLHH